MYRKICQIVEITSNFTNIDKKNVNIRQFLYIDILSFMWMSLKYNFHLKKNVLKLFSLKTKCQHVATCNTENVMLVVPKMWTSFK
jgi:hypothetical protein